MFVLLHVLLSDNYSDTDTDSNTVTANANS